MLWLSQASGARPSSLFETTSSSVSWKNDLAFPPRLPLTLIEDALMSLSFVGLGSASGFFISYM